MKDNDPMRPTMWTLIGLIGAAYYAHENPIDWVCVAVFAIPFIKAMTEGD